MIVIDKKKAAAFIGGTITRGILWGAGLLCQWAGYEMTDKDWATGAGVFVAGTLIEVAATLWSKWSKKKDKE